ncbi:MAG: Rhodanese domain protein [Candidatus Gallionella acididurans]|uniref:Rhodanese domain protein n=1 Tax=Candidatus Gallionella acididurans TaxID=1796491 RepID=A0A139BRC2_9PROT|nr:MAG: Rhodanese domain protein [Candidatus Gallionella acididurans]
MQFISNNIFPIGMAVFSGIMLLWSYFGNRFKGVKEVNSSGALQLINHKSAVVLDVREPGEYESGHVLNSKLIPLGKLKERIGELEKYKDHSIVVLCRSGNRSGTACFILGKHGFNQAYNLAGGIQAWKKANLPVEK